MAETNGEAASTSDEQYPLRQQQQGINIPVTARLTPNLPRRFLLAGPRKNYLKVGLPLYEASIKCDWKAAKAILDKNPELARYSITENGETALHIAVSAKRSKKMEVFVEHLVDMMDMEDLLLENEHFNTAFYVAAASGNVEPMKIMVKKNESLLIIPGGRGKMMPLYVAALVGHHEVVKYLYENSNDLCDDGCDRQNRGWLLQKCVENDMFESMIPPSYREPIKNKDGLTPRELFTMEHTNLITQGEKWMKETASQCMVVAALIATIVFAAAFTVPGGYNQNDGIPMFYRKITFVVFVVADAISLFLSSASILTFLSILTSRYAERDFLESLPKKLMLGLAALFLSITTMVVTFSISFFILYHQEMKWIPILICVSAISPVLLYAVLRCHLLIDVIRSTYGSKYLFKPTNRVLFYENPKF